MLERASADGGFYRPPEEMTPRTISSSSTPRAPREAEGDRALDRGYLTAAAPPPSTCFDLQEDDVYWCTADIGWVTGHSYLVYGPLASGATCVMYEGAPDWPEKDRFWQICERYGVTVFYTAPTAIRAFMKWGAEFPKRHDLSRCACSARSVSRSTPRRGSGTRSTSARGAARSSTRGGRPRPARS
jgi:acetyl-CoA synthetase